MRLSTTLSQKYSYNKHGEVFSPPSKKLNLTKTQNNPKPNHYTADYPQSS